MIDNKEKKYNDENKESLISFFSILIKYISKSNPETYDDLLNDKNSMIKYLNYSNKLLNCYLFEKESINEKKKLITNRKLSRIIEYLIKSLRKKKSNGIYKDYNDEIKKNINKFFIIFIFNLFNEIIKYQNELNANNNKMEILNKLLNKIVYIFGRLYLGKIIKDENFELILKFFLIFSITKSIESIDFNSNEKYEIINFKFFNSCISLIKNIFNYLFELQNEFTQKQEDIINNIILFIKNNMIDSADKCGRNSYVNRIFLSKNDYKTTLLIDLIFIISKTKSKNIINNFIDLLTNIYSFSFNFENIITPMFKQLEPLFANLQKKNIKEINEELIISDFPISLLDSLIRNENEIKRNKSCFLKQGFYFGNDTSGLSCDINSLENEFIILFGFRIEKTKEDKITLFSIKNNKERTAQFKLFLKKDYNRKNYEIIVEDKKEQEHSLSIYISEETNYILAIHFKIGGLMHQTTLKVFFVKDKIEQNLEEFKVNIKNGKELKIKNFKNENFTIYFGCEYKSIQENSKFNNFSGFLGDIIIINSKNLKNSINNININEILMSLEGNYSDILSIIEENQENNIFIKKKSANNKKPKFIELKEKIKLFGENENKLFDSIKGIISSKFFKLINYQDELDYIKANNKVIDIEKNQFYIQKKYTEFKNKSDPLEDERMIKIYSSIFDKNFHIFENKFTLEEFIKYDGIDYLSLLMEYYYQILCQICIKINDNQENDIKEICKKININIFNILLFIYKNIMQIIKEIDIINKFFYQMAITLLKLLEIDTINIETIKCISNILDYIDNSEDINYKIDSIKISLFDFLLNKKLYQKKDEKYLEKLNFTIQRLRKIIVDNSKNQTRLMKRLYNVDILNKLLSFLWLIDTNNFSNINENCFIDFDKENKGDNLFENTSFYYSKLLIDYLIFFEQINKIPNKSLSQKTLNNKNQINNENKIDLKMPKTASIQEYTDDDKLIINYFFDQAVKYSFVNYYIFANMLSLLVKANIIKPFDESRIDKIKSIIISEIKIKDEKSKNNSLFISCLKFLISYYFTDNRNSRYKENNLKNKEDNFHIFIRRVNINLDFFYSLISILKEIQSLNFNSLDDKDENKIENNLKNKDNVSLKKGQNNLSSIPIHLLNLDFKNLNDFQIHIIKSIFEDIVFSLYKFGLRKRERSNSENILEDSFNDTIEQNIEKEIYDILKKNIDYIFKFNNTQIYQDIFSSDSEICAELFYLKWKFGINEGGDNYAEKAIMKYHKYLLKNHSNPFIFKFYLFISNIELFAQEASIKDNIKQKTNKTKITLLNFIVNTLFDFHKEIKAKKEINIFLINNLLNILIILNEELLSRDSSLFQMKSFNDIFFKLISLLEKTCLLYSNYYIESDEKCGKTVSEIIYDIFFELSEENIKEQEFMKVFTKENIKEQEIFTIFYLIDIFKEDILEKEQKINEELKKFIPDIDNLKNIHKNIFTKKKSKSKVKLFLNKNLYQIEDANFSIYFLAKSFIYLKKNEINEKLKKILMKKFLRLLSKNIFRLYTKRSNFYGNKICPKFPLYSETKIFIETYIIPNPNKFDSYEEFFNTDMPIKLKEEYNIGFCFSSRLIHDFRREIDQNRNEVNSIIDNNPNNELQINNNINDPESTQYWSRTSSFVSAPFLPNIDIENINNIKYFTSNLEDIESSKFLDYSMISENEGKDCLSNLELIEKKNIIFNPKNFFFKKIFAQIYQNLIFNDNIFKSIKLAYLLTFRKFNICKETKQFNYPVKQKNFSNSIEPKIFLRKNFSFYNEEYLKTSHSYIKIDMFNKYLKNIILYPHNYKIKNQKEDLKFLFCELVTTQYIYFGIMYFFDSYIFFESTKDDPRYNTDDLEEFTKYAISTMTKNDKPLKVKEILIYNEDINEIIKRRTLYLYQSLEIFHKNGKSYFFNFFKKEIAKKAYDCFSEINQNLLKNNLSQFIFSTNNNEEEIKNLFQSFHKGKFSNY